MKRQPISATKASPAAAASPPTGAKSNMRNGSPTISCRIEADDELGGVPIQRAIPAKDRAKLSGIRA